MEQRISMSQLISPKVHSAAFEYLPFHEECIKSASLKFLILTFLPFKCSWPYNMAPSYLLKANEPLCCTVLKNNEGEQHDAFTVHLKNYSTLLDIKLLKQIPVHYSPYPWL